MSALERGLRQLWAAEHARLTALLDAEIEALATEAARLPHILRDSQDLAADGLDVCVRLDDHLNHELAAYAASLSRFTATMDVLVGSSLTGLAHAPDPMAPQRLFGSLGFPEVCAAAIELTPPLALAQLRSPRRPIQAHVTLAAHPLIQAVEAALVSRVA